MSHVEEMYCEGRVGSRRHGVENGEKKRKMNKQFWLAIVVLLLNLVLA